MNEPREPISQEFREQIAQRDAAIIASWDFEQASRTLWENLRCGSTSCAITDTRARAAIAMEQRYQAQADELAEVSALLAQRPAHVIDGDQAAQLTADWRTVLQVLRYDGEESPYVVPDEIRAAAQRIALTMGSWLAEPESAS